MQAIYAAPAYPEPGSLRGRSVGITRFGALSDSSVRYLLRGWGLDPERDVFAALERWVEKDQAPDHFIGQGVATNDPAKMLTRPICQYPNVARYKGSGDLNDAANFTCAAPARR